MAESEDNLSSVQSEDEEITRILDGRFFLWFIFRYNISFTDPQLVRFGDIFPSVMVSLQEIFRRIPLATGL